MADVFAASIPGSYIGESVEDGKISIIELEINERYCISKIVFTDDSSADHQKKVEWKLSGYLDIVTYKWKMDGRSNKTDISSEKRLNREGQTLKIETIQNEESQGPYLFESDKLVVDSPSLSILKPTADKKGLYVQFNINIPAIGTVPGPDNYDNRVFRATATQFNARCQPKIFFAGNAGDGPSPTECENVKGVGTTMVAWKDNTNCRFEFPALMRCFVHFSLADYIGIDPNIHNSKAGRWFIIQLGIVLLHF